MANINSDIIEEDAADLQFPKDWTINYKHHNKFDISVRKEEIFTLDSTCYTCNCPLIEPYIRCAICEYVILCVVCFANGQEKSVHKNDHNYMIIKNDFTLFEETNWIAKDEISLLELIQDCGFGNWIDISCRLPGKSPDECKKHYLQYYIDNQFVISLPTFKENSTSLFSLDPITYNFKLEDVEDPPRFIPGTTNFKLLAGYNSARSDFEINFDNHAELLIANLKYTEFSPEETYYELGKKLQISLINSYNVRLKERARRKKIVRDHGLISLRKAMSCLQRYDTTITRPLSDRLRIFTQLIDGIEFDAVMECLHQIGELKNHLRQLFNYRNNGIKQFYSISIFDELCKIRQEVEKEKKQYNNIESSWCSILPNISNENHFLTSNIFRRKIAPPLDIHPGMTGYEKLLPTEKELCSVTRILPDAYMDLKSLLISENKKYGSVKLAQARQLLKIDVNKTKKIHQFLAKEGYINVD